MSALPNEIPSIRVAVVEPGAKSESGWHVAEIGKAIVFKTEDLNDYRTKNWDSRVYDAMVLIAAVEYCDKALKRSGLLWARRFDLRLPVHDVKHWQSPAVVDAIARALKFLTGDEWNITYTAATTDLDADMGRQSLLEWGDAGRTVTPFSDGLDSRAVSAILSANGRGDRIIRVRVGSKADDRPIRDRKKVPFLNIPFTVNMKAGGIKESSVRSRGFKFTLLSSLAAYLVGTHDVAMPESGQGALGPTLVPASHGYEDYRNHPRFLRKMETVVEAVFHHAIRFRLPQLWRTKGQTLAEFASIERNPDEWNKTRSCWQQSRNSSFASKRRHCGVCAACMLRRLSFHAAGIDEPKENYIWEDLRAKDFAQGAVHGFDKVTRAMRRYGIAGALHLDHLAEMSASPLHRIRVKRSAWQLAEQLQITTTQAEEHLFGLLEQHDREWQAFMKNLGPKSFIAQWLA
ncbi:7-cyano-7-deazaguanine synthase [Rhizobium leguminosarum]|uniref:7-cyano-7-deazaguanine synthase n=1 Tax=Rhizobium leguminosarum TaxID=384 RepID=UPI001F418C51|nr:7-cyano-7-deazaguanine synthase [Rhizobium leguminosarum]UIJ82405.1 7-cyano-7-deazaguanine synthase [Rhizobium leguminosarum]